MIARNQLHMVRKSGSVALWAGSAMLLAMPAYAQDSATAGQGGTAIGAADIIVTAQRRAERLEQVPATVSYLAPEALTQSGVVGLTDLPKVVPGVNVSRTGAFTQPTIRGVGSFITGPGLENNVAIYVDGFYLPTTVANAFDLVDIENIQVLKGPQGSLYGRNATGGAFIITTRDPSEEPNVEIKATYARFDDRRLSFTGSTGIGEGAAIGLSAYYRESDGYVRDIITGKDSAPLRNISIRPKLKIEPSDTFSVVLTLEYANVRDPSGLALSTYRGNTAARAIDPTTPIATGPHQTSLNLPPKVEADVYGAYLRMKLDVGDVSITSLTSHRQEDTEYEADLDGSILPIFHVLPWNQTQKTTTQELIISQTGETFDWLVGGSFYHDDSFLKNFTVFGANLFSPSQKTTAASAYVDATWRPIPRLAITAGGRYSTERKQFIQRTAENAPPYLDVHERFNGFTPRAAVRYELFDGGNVYASFGRGFKSGLYNTSGADTRPVNPEKITAYEAGFKYGRGDLRFEIAAFHYRYNDLQTTAYDFTAGGTQRVLNAGSARIKGVEASLNYSMNNAIDVRAGATYLHARYKDFSNAQDYCPVLAEGTLPTPGSITCPQGTPIGGSNAYNVDASGQPLSRAPDFTATAGIDYHMPLADGKLTLSGNVYYTSSISFSPNGRLKQPEYALVGLRGTWSAPDERWSIAVFGDNIFDKKYVQGFFYQQLGDFAFYGAPATYGVTATFKFK